MPTAPRKRGVKTTTDDGKAYLNVADITGVESLHLARYGLSTARAFGPMGTPDEKIMIIRSILELRANPRANLADILAKPMVDHVSWMAETDPTVVDEAVDPTSASS